jgi:hypothetical protein
MTERIEELAKMAYEAGHHPTSADFADIGPAAKENLRIIVRTLYAAIMTEAEDVARERQAFFLKRSNEREGPAEVFELARGNAAQTIADALHARAKEIAP